jgi:hypothetical protein
MHTVFARAAARTGVDYETGLVLAFGWFVALFVTLT